MPSKEWRCESINLFFDGLRLAVCRDNAHVHMNNSNDTSGGWAALPHLPFNGVRKLVSFFSHTALLLHAMEIQVRAENSEMAHKTLPFEL